MMGPVLYLKALFILPPHVGSFSFQQSQVQKKDNFNISFLLIAIKLGTMASSLAYFPLRKEFVA